MNHPAVNKEAFNTIMSRERTVLLTILDTISGSKNQEMLATGGDRGKMNDYSRGNNTKGNNLNLHRG